MIWPFRRRREPPPRTAEAAAGAGLCEGWFEALLRDSGFVARYPQFAGVLATMRPVLTDVVPFMAVGLRHWGAQDAGVHLLVNPAMLTQHRRLVAGVLLHEVHHVVLGHLADPKFHHVAIPAAMEVAMELSANEHIDEPTPPMAFAIGRFARFGIAPGQSTLERYAKLASAVARGELKLPDLRRMTWDQHRPRQTGGDALGPGDLLDARSDAATAKNWNRDGGLGHPTPDSELHRMRERIAQHLGGGSKGGDLHWSGQHRRAKELPRRLLGDGDRARLDWPRILREVFPQPRLVHPDYKRPNRRFPARVGELPGRTRRPPRARLLVAIDTSGSMDVPTLLRVVAEVRILRRLAECTLVQCDAAVHMLPHDADLDLLVGGGDTDFGPVFAELPTMPDVRGVVYFTDGVGELPGHPPDRATLWVITHERPFAPAFGSILRLPDPAQPVHSRPQRGS